VLVLMLVIVTSSGSGDWPQSPWRFGEPPLPIGVYQRPFFNWRKWIAQLHYSPLSAPRWIDRSGRACTDIFVTFLRAIRQIQPYKIGIL